MPKKYKKRNIWRGERKKGNPIGKRLGRGTVNTRAKFQGLFSRKRRGHWTLKEFGVLCLNHQPVRRDEDEDLTIEQVLRLYDLLGRVIILKFTNGGWHPRTSSSYLLLVSMVHPTLGRFCSPLTIKVLSSVSSAPTFFFP